jgi:hypothetical protein
VDRESEGLLGAILNRIAGKGVNLYKDVLLPLVKEGTGPGSPALAKLLGGAAVEEALEVFSLAPYVIDPCDRAILYEEDDPHFDFYDWVFPEDRWCAMVRAFLALCERFREERGFVLPLPTLIYFIRKDDASLLSRSRRADMMAVDPTYPDPKDPGWLAFRLAFNEVAMAHGGIPNINKMHGGAIDHFVKAHDGDAIKDYLAKRREFDPKDLFLNDFFKTLFGAAL